LDTHIFYLTLSLLYSISCRILSFSFWYFARLYCSSFFFLFQTPSANTHFLSLHDALPISSTKPFCFFRIGSTFSSMVSASCLFLSGLEVSAIIWLNKHFSPFVVEGRKEPVVAPTTDSFFQFFRLRLRLFRLRVNYLNMMQT